MFCYMHVAAPLAASEGDQRMKTQIDEEELLDRGGHPTLREILRHLVFSPIHGSIKLNDARLVLQRASYNAHLRDELVRSYGKHDARVLLSRLGFRAGIEDAKFVQKSWPNLDLGDAFTAGTRLHTANGIVRVETLHNDFDFRKGKYSSEFRWHDSVEAMEYLRNHSTSTEPVCWSQLGYAAGYATHFFSELIVFKEIQCTAMGHASCKLIGKAAKAWGEEDEIVRMYREEVLRTARPVSTRPDRARGPLPAQGGDGVSSLPALLLAPVKEHLDRAAQASVPLLITGPRGSGKREAARYFHAASAEPGARFRHLPCSEVDTDALEKALAQMQPGGTKGRSTSDRPGTLLLEDIEHLSPGAQIQLVDLLESGDAPRRRARLAATSTLSLAELSALPGLRTDIFHRLAVLPLSMPALSKRRDDVPELAMDLLGTIARRQSRPASKLTQAALRYLSARDYPGNYPELESLLTRALLRAKPGQAIDVPDLRSCDLGTPPSQTGKEQLEVLLRKTIEEDGICLDELNRRIYNTAMTIADGNVSSAARMLDLSRAQLAYRLRQQRPPRSKVCDKRSQPELSKRKHDR